MKYRKKEKIKEFQRFPLPQRGFLWFFGCTLNHNRKCRLRQLRSLKYLQGNCAGERTGEEQLRMVHLNKESERTGVVLVQVINMEKLIHKKENK